MIIRTKIHLKKLSSLLSSSKDCTSGISDWWFVYIWCCWTCYHRVPKDYQPFSLSLSPPLHFYCKRYFRVLGGAGHVGQIWKEQRGEGTGLNRGVCVIRIIKRFSADGGGERIYIPTLTVISTLISGCWMKMRVFNQT